MGRLAGKRALMTGAGGLLGSDLARAFAAEGADLVLTTRTASKLDPLIEEVRGFDVRAKAVAADFTSNDDIDRLAQEAWDAFDGLDIVLLSSQPSDPNQGDLLTCPEEIFAEQHQTIVWGPLRMMRQLAPKMMEQGGGSIVTITSSTGFDPMPGFDAYGLAKGSLWMLTKYMAAEWGHKGIRVNAFQPGLVATSGDNVEQLEKHARERGVLDRTALGRLGRNSECVGAAIYLASDESSFTSGQRINIDGGRY